MLRPRTRARGWAWIMMVAGLCGTPLSAGRAADDLRPVDVFQSGRGGYHTYRIPALLVAPDRSLLAFCEGRKTSRADHGDVDLVLRRSSDGGRTWSPLQLVFEVGGTQKVTIGNPCPVVDRDTGRIWLSFTRDNDRVYVTSSGDNGVSWDPPREITATVKSQDWTWYATGPGVGIQLRQDRFKGRLVIPCDHRVRGAGSRSHSTRSHAIYSDDHGRTWRAGQATDWLMNECAVVELRDGRLLLNMRSNRGRQRRAVAWSRDGGQSWTPAVDAESLIEPVCQASLIGYEGSAAGLLLFCNPASTRQRARLTVRCSRDGGTTWSAGRVIDAGPAAYSCLAQLPDGDVGVLYERGGYSTLTFVRFPLEWLTGNG